MTATPSSAHVHNSACETAALADCHCFCHGAGHQNDLIVRAATCSNTADMTSLTANLEKVLGGFHSNFRDISTHTRKARNTLTAQEVAALRPHVWKGATWIETLLVDEALHAAFIAVASQSVSASETERQSQKVFVDRITQGAIQVVGTQVLVTNVVESHVWCSIVSEYLASLTPSTASEPHPRTFSKICYPRKSIGSFPSSLAGVQAAGLAHLTSAEASAQSLSPARRLALLRLVGAATCPDLWRHPAAVRFCIVPFVNSNNWPPSNTTSIATNPDFDTLRGRWRRKRNW
jgi:hypothetical protein